jgi:hypothetical protein
MNHDYCSPGGAHKHLTYLVHYQVLRLWHNVTAAAFVQVYKFSEGFFLMIYGGVYISEFARTGTVGFREGEI